MTNPNLDLLIAELKSTEATEKFIAEKKATLRKEIFGIIENEGLTDGYKNPDATVSYVERKKIIITDPELLLQDFQNERLVKYMKKIPAHIELTKTFEDDVKAGTFKHQLVKVEVANNLAIRFGKA